MKVPRREVVLGIAVAIALVAGVELALRAVGFSRETAPIAMRFGYPDPREIAGLFQPDPRLFWRMRPSSVFDAEAPVRINARGYRGPLPREPRPDALVRIAVSGDSVAFGGAAAWPEIVAERLGPSAEVLNFAVPGYSIVQGARQLEDEVLPLRPNTVLVAYGWNDHWLARAGVPDDALPTAGGLPARVALVVSRLRLAQALHLVLVREARPTGVRRVPLPGYRDHLVGFLRKVRGAGGRPIVVGLPSALTLEATPAYLVDGGFTPSASAAVADHAAYLEASREAARAEGVGFVDGSVLGTDPRLFTGDRIHLSAEGHAALAELAVRALR